MDKATVKEMEINGITYVPKCAIQQMAEPVDGLKPVIIRTYSAGVHYGYLKSRDGKEVVLVNSRRIWRWEGANTCSELALHGLDHTGSKVSEPVPHITLTEAIEIIECTEESRESLEGAKWETE